MTQVDRHSRTRPVGHARSTTDRVAHDAGADHSRRHGAAGSTRAATTLGAVLRGIAPLITIIVFGTSLAGCAGLQRSVELQPDDRVIVQTFSPAAEKRPRDLRQTLCNENVVDRDEFYRARSTDPLTKVISNEAMQLLLDALSSAGFFEIATDRQLVHGWAELHVTINGKELHLVCHNDMPPAHYDAYEKSAAAFLDLYNATTAYRSAAGTNSVLEQHERAHRGSRR